MKDNNKLFQFLRNDCSENANYINIIMIKVAFDKNDFSSIIFIKNESFSINQNLQSFTVFFSNFVKSVIMIVLKVTSLSYNHHYIYSFAFNLNITL